MTDYLKSFEDIVKSKTPSFKDSIRALKIILGFYLDDFKEFMADPHQFEAFGELDEFSSAVELSNNYDEIVDMYNSLKIGSRNFPKDFNKGLDKILQKIKTDQEEEDRKKEVERKLRGEKKRSLQQLHVPSLIDRCQSEIATAAFSLEAIISGILKLSKVLRENPKITCEESDLIERQISAWGDQIIMREGELILATRSVEDVMKNLNKILPDGRLREVPENLISWKMDFSEKNFFLRKKRVFQRILSTASSDR